MLAKTAVDLPFKSLVAGTDVTIDVGADTLTINSVAGGGGGLPAGAVNQGLRNDAGTNTYVATGGLLIAVGGNVAVGPGSVVPIVPLQVSGTATLLAGGTLNLNNPADSSTSKVRTVATNRMELESPAGGGIDLFGAVSTGEAVRLYANSQIVFSAIGAVASRAEIRHGGVAHFLTTALGIQTHGDFQVKELGGGEANRFTVDGDGGHFEGTVESFGTATFAALTTTTGGVTSAAQVNINSAAPTAINHATRKDYVDGLNATNVKTTGNQQINGIKTFGSVPVFDVGATFESTVNITGDVQNNGTMNALIINSTLGNITSNSQSISLAASPGQVQHLTRKDYVDAAVSDMRLKRKITPLSPVLDAVRLLETFSFEYEEDAPRKRAYHQRRYGMSAQELEIDFPHAVHHLATDRDDETGESVSGEHYLGVDYAELVPVLVKAIQELTAKVEALEN